MTLDVSWATRPERFANAAKDPQHAIAQELPAPPASKLAPAMLLLFLPVWLSIGALILSIAYRMPDARLLALAAAAFIGLGAVGIVVAIVRQLRAARAAVVRAIAVIVEKRQEVSSRHHHDPHHDHISTRYFATLQLADATRIEAPAAGPIVGTLVPGDIGLAVVRAGDLIDFHRFRE